MNILSLSALKPMEVEYRHDGDVNIPNYTTNFLYGLNLKSNNLFNLARDLSINYYNSFILSDKLDKSDFLTLTTPVSVTYPKKISTTIQNLRLSSYGTGFWVDYDNNSTTATDLSCNNIIFSNGTIYDLGSWNVYEINFLSETECTISKLRQAPPYTSIELQQEQFLELTVDQDVNYVSFVSLSSSSATPPKFNYVYDNVRNAIVFYKNYKPTGNDNSSSIFVLAQENYRIISKSLDVNVISDSGLYNEDAVFALSYRDANTRLGKFTTNYNSYKKFFYPTSETSYFTSMTGLKNNYLISSDVLFTDNKFKINFQPLKNQLDTSYNFTNNNSFSGNDFDNRDYQSIITGTNQELGFPDLTLTYYTYNAPLQFKKGALTYFHFPVSATPFTQLNINDTKLVENGAFAGDNPLDSDKVFKKLEDTANRKYITDNETGSYLCTWLYTSAFDSKPIWLDRYYNPNFSSVKDGFLNTGFITTVQEISAQSFTYFDKVSDLLFEPNASYSYYRISEKDITRMVNVLDEKKTSEDTIKRYDLNYNLQDSNSEVVDIKTSKGTISQSLTSSGDYSFSFNVKSKDYKQRKGGILLSTFNGDTGLVVSNIKQLSNINLFTSGGEVLVCDQEYNLLNKIQILLDKNTFTVPDRILSVEYDNSIDGYYVTSAITSNIGAVTTNSDTYFYITRLDSNFSILNTYPLTSFSGDYKGSLGNFISSNVDSDYYYALMSNIRVNNINEGNYSYFAIKYPLSGFELTTPLPLSSYFTKLNLPFNTSENGNNNITFNDFVNYYYTWNFTTSGDQIVYYITDYKCNTIVTDIFNKPWYVFDKTLFHTVTNIGSLSGFNIVYDKKIDANGEYTQNCIESITTDINGNIYFTNRDPLNITRTELVKLDNKRVPIFKIPLSSNVSLSAYEYLDINYELKNGRLYSYPTVIFDDYSISSLSAGGLKGVIKFDEDGKEILNKNLDFDSDSLIASSNNRIGIRKPLSNNDNIIKAISVPRNSFVFDFYLKDKNSDREVISLSHDLKNLTNDDLFFTFTFDSLNGIARLYINGVQVDSDNTNGVKYSDCNFSNNISINTLNYLPLNLYTTFFNGGDLTFSNLKTFNKSLNKFDVRNLYLQTLKFEDLNWNVPAGKRSIQETIKSNFKFGLQDYKTNLFDIIVTGTQGLTDIQKMEISAQVREYLKGNIPINTIVNEIEIRNNE